MLLLAAGMAAARFARAAQVPPELLGRIEGFGFASRARMGVGGFVTVDIYPVVLFRSGELLTEVAALRDPRGLEAHRAAKPASWTQWRRAGGELQRLTAGGWEKLPFQTVYARLPDDLRWEGLFRSLRGVGNVAMGGNQAVSVVDEYRFAADGTVTRGGAVGGQAAAGDASVVTRGGAGPRRGRYRVQGLVLRIDYDDGTREERLLIADPADPARGLWLDGEAYARRRP